MPDNQESGLPRYGGSAQDLRLLWGLAPSGANRHEFHQARQDRSADELSRNDSALRRIWATNGDTRYDDRHEAIKIAWKESPVLYSEESIRNRGWKMIRAPGRAISVTGDTPQDLLFVIDKYSSNWHGRFRFGGIGLLKVEGLGEGEVWSVGHVAEPAAQSSKRPRQEAK